jgi:hypothetical protein
VLIGESDDLPVGFVRGIKEGSVADVVPEIEVDVTKVLGHEGLELLAVDMVVHVAVENEVRKSLLDLQQGSFVLSVWDRPSADVRVLSGNGTHPRILDTLVEFVPEGDARLGEGFSSRTEICERRIEQLRNKVQNPLRGDGRLHAAVWEGAHEDDTADQIDIIVCREIGGSDTTHGPMVARYSLY